MPYAALFSIDATTPWILRASQIKNDGYPNYKVCYKCTNKESVTGSTEQTHTNLITIRQKINCDIALPGNSTSLLLDFTNPAGTHHAALAYNAQLTAMPLVGGSTQYDDSVRFFQNINGADCGGFTQCELRPIGCGTSTAYSGKLSMAVIAPFAITIMRNVNDGYTESLCVHCQNLAGSTTQKDNWTIQQARNCALSMTAKTVPPANKYIDYVNSASDNIIINGWSTFFDNVYP